MRVTIALIATLLAGCATLPAGEDPQGLELKKEAAPVQVAIAKYREDKGEFPSSLYELVPRYLPAVPFGPNLHLDRERKMLELSYELTWPQGGHVLCEAPLGELQWKCQ